MASQVLTGTRVSKTQVPHNSSAEAEPDPSITIRKAGSLNPGSVREGNQKATLPTLINSCTNTGRQKLTLLLETNCWPRTAPQRTTQRSTAAFYPDATTVRCTLRVPRGQKGPLRCSLARRSTQVSSVATSPRQTTLRYPTF